MKKAFQYFGGLFLALIIFSFWSANAWGLGQLTLVAKTDVGKIKVSLIEE
ncbi:hypothetical protein MNBD_NITROSPINAE05-165, partial [hydrothermal vent metagenome]